MQVRWGPFPLMCLQANHTYYYLEVKYLGSLYGFEILSLLITSLFLIIYFALSVLSIMISAFIKKKANVWCIVCPCFCTFNLFMQYLYIWRKFLNLKWSEVSKFCLTFCDPLDYTVLGILRARILERVAFPFSRGSSQPKDQIQVSHIAGGFFTSWATREIQEYWSG